MTKSITILTIFILSFTVNGQNAADINDFKVNIHEEAINKILTAIGPIKGTNDYEVLLIKGKYHWTVLNPRMMLRPDSSQFLCNAKVEVGPFDYVTQVKGDVKITYNQAKNEIQIKITRAIFELYTMVFNKKVHIKDIDLANYFKDPFVFEGPRSMLTDFNVSMPDGTTKTIYIQPTLCNMNVLWKEISAACELEACDVPYLIYTPKKADKAEKPANSEPAKK